MIVDSHNHFGVRKGENFPAETLIAWLDRAGVDACVATSQPESYDNEYTAAAQRQYPDRIIGYAVVNPWLYSAEEELEHCFRDLHLYGLKLNTLRHGYALDRHQIVDPIFEICDHYHKPVLCHGESDMFNMPGKFEEMARTFPNVKLILAHIGQPDAVDAAIRAANRYENIYVDTAGVGINTLRQAIAGMDPHKILMGTDASWGRFELSVALVKKATDDEKIRSLIMGENICRLLNWKR